MGMKNQLHKNLTGVGNAAKTTSLGVLTFRNVRIPTSPIAPESVKFKIAKYISIYTSSNRG